MSTAQRIDTFQDLLSLLRDNPELAEQLRLHVLTQELLALPAAFAAFAAKTDAAIAALDKRMSNVENDVTELKAGQQRLEAGQQRLENDVTELKAGYHRLENDVTELKAGQQRLENDVTELKAGYHRLEIDVGELKAGYHRLEIDVGELKAGYHRLEIDVGELKGDAALRATRFLTYDIAEGLGMRIVRDLPRAEVRTMAREQRTGDMPRHHLQSFARADAVIEAATPDGNTAYIAVEASYTADERDTFRAIRNAHYLRRMTGQPARAAVSAARLDNRIRPLVDCGAVFWHQLTPEDFSVD